MRTPGILVVLLTVLLQSTVAFAMFPEYLSSSEPVATESSLPCHTDADSAVGSSDSVPSDHCASDFCDCGATCNGLQAIPSRVLDALPTPLRQVASNTSALLSAHPLPLLRPPATRFID